MKLDASNAGRYRKVARVKAFHVGNGATYHLSWGDLHYPGPHWLILQGDEAYGCAEDSFTATYEPVAEEPDTYRKTGLIWAVQMDAPFEVLTKEGPEVGQAGDWLAQQLDGEQWFIPDETFRATYRPVEAPIAAS